MTRLLTILITLALLVALCLYVWRSNRCVETPGVLGKREAISQDQGDKKK